MKKNMKWWVLLFVLTLILGGCGTAEKNNEKQDETVVSENENKEETVEYPYDYASADFFEIENWWDYAPVASVSGVLEGDKPFSLDAVDGFTTMQGGCTDGTYAYFLLEKKNVMDAQGVGHSYCMLFKVDMTTWEVVGQSEALAVDHGNSMTYCTKTNQLLVAHCQNRTQEFSYIDPDTLTVTGSKSLGRNFYSITYNATYDKYVIGIKGTDKFVIYDGEFNPLGEYQGVQLHENGKLAYQNIYCDDDYIYITYTGDVNAIMCYDWNGYFCGVLKVDSYQENEAMFQVGDQYYMTFYTGGGGKVYRLDFEKDLLF